MVLTVTRGGHRWESDSEKHWVYFGLATFRKGHYWLFWIGFILPILWIIGALIGPTPRAAARMA
jgi:hypothetical protein